MNAKLDDDSFVVEATFGMEKPLPRFPLIISLPDSSSHFVGNSSDYCYQDQRVDNVQGRCRKAFKCVAGA